MKILADENVPGRLVKRLKAAGHDVTWIKHSSPGIDDRLVIDQAEHDQRVLLTFDKDFGELAVRHKLPANSGIILLRVPYPKQDSDIARLEMRISNRDDWAGLFAVMDDKRLRMRPLHP